jgi:cytoskeletal protein RodZ
MSNSTRQGGYDERLVVPLEASRRGAHRARTNPLVAALPLLVVVVVVAAVIGVAYALFLKPSTDTSANDPLTSPTAPGATSAPSATQPSATASKSSSASSASSSASSSPAASVDKTVTFSVANGSGKTGLAARATSALKRAGFSGASVDTNGWHGTPVGSTSVFYAKDSQKATAEAIATALGNGHARKSSADANGGIVVVAFDEPTK